MQITPCAGDLKPDPNDGTIFVCVFACVTGVMCLSIHVNNNNNNNNNSAGSRLFV